MTRLAQVIKGCQNKFICDLNPHSKNSWVYKYFILKICPITGEPLPNHEEIAYAQINPKDNIAHLGEEYIRTLSNLPEHQRVRFLNGEFADTAGSIFKHIETVDSFPEYLDYSIGIDFGFTTDPATIVKVGVESEYIYIEELLYEHGLTNSDLIQRMNTIGIGAFDIIFADSAEPKSVEELRRAGYSNISGCTKGADSIRNGIDWMLSHKLRIVRGSNHTISEFQNLQWAKTSSGDNIAKPMPGNDHTVDGVRYALNNHITGSSAEACISFSM
jgi:phage terminase large subunit